jgi:tetratricopeptide (TPR) repeat protein
MSRGRLVIGIVGVFSLVVGGAVAWRVVVQRRQAASLAGSPAEGVDLGSTAAVLKAARTYIGSQELGKAEAVLRRALETRPDDALMREMLGDVLLQGEDDAGAMAQYADLADRTDATAEVLFKAGSLAAGMGDHDRAVGYLTRSLEKDAGLIDASVQLANAELELGRIDDAKATLARAAVLDDGLGVVWGMLAEIAVRENKLEIATQHIEKARRIEPNNLAWRVLEARVKRRQGDPETAVMLLDGIRGDDRFEPPVLEEMASALGMLGRGSDALSIYRVAVRERPDDAEIRYQAAIWAEREGERAEAMEFARVAAMMGDERAKAVVERLEED